MANRDYTIAGPDGREVTITGPDDATPAQLRAAAEKAFSIAAPEPVTRADLLKRELLRSPPVALARGFKDIVDTGADWLSNLGGADENARVKAMNAAGKAEFDEAAKGQFMPQFARFGGNVAATAPVGPALSVYAKAAGAPAALVNALQSAGMTTGGRAPGALNLLKDIGTRSLAGGIVGGASTGLIDPEHAGTGAMIGAATPPVLGSAGAVAKWIGGLFRSGAVKSADDLARALDLLSPADRQAAVAQLRATPELVPGSGPTVAQALRTPTASTLEAVVSDTPGGAAIKERYLAQNAARRSALERIMPTNIDGLATAKQDLGEAIESYVIPERNALRNRLNTMYAAVDDGSTRITLPFDEFDAASKKYLGPGTFLQGGPSKAAISEARKVGMVDLPAVKAAAAEREHTLLDFVKASGGINRSNSEGLSGEIQDLLERGLGRFSFKNKGKSIDKMAEIAHEAGYLRSEDPAELVEALMSAPGTTRSVGRDAIRAAESAMGDLPQAERVPVPVTWEVVQNLRASIGALADELVARGKAPRDVAALTSMKKSLDDAMMNTATGKGKPGDYMPADVMAKFLEANKSYSEFAKRFKEGTNAEIFRANGPRGSQIAGKYWRGGDGSAERVEDFQRLIGDMPGLMDQFRSLVTTDAASKMTAADQLSNGYVRWVKDKLPALRKAFTPEQVELFRAVADDIKRATVASAAGASKGSPTYRNAASAVNLGLFGRTLKAATTNKAVSYVPIAGEVVREGANSVADAATRAKVERLAYLLSTPDAAANALELLAPNALARMTANPQALNLLYRATPVGLAANH